MRPIEHDREGSPDHRLGDLLKRLLVACGGWAEKDVSAGWPRGGRWCWKGSSTGHSFVTCHAEMEELDALLLKKA